MRKEIFIGPLLLLLIWWLLTATGWIKPLFLASPPEVGEALWNGCRGDLPRHVAATLQRFAFGFGAAGVVAIPLGLLIGAQARVYATVEVPIDFFRSLPAMAMFPMFMLAFGLGDPSKVAITAWSGALIIIVNTIYGVRSAKQLRQDAARVFGASPFQIFVKVILPDALPQVFAGLRTAVSICLIVVVVSEMFMGTDKGLGLVIYNASLMYNTARMTAGILLAGALGYGINKAFVIIEGHLIHWAGK